MSGNTVFVAFDEHNIYYTGLSNLFSQPEFQSIDLVRNLSKIIDHLDEVMNDFFSVVGDKTLVLLGKDNPFSNDCSCLVARYGNGIFGILGPIRMDYKHNLALLDYIKELID